MSLTIDVYHNVSDDPMRFLDGYKDGDPLVLVARYVSSSDPTRGVMTALEQVYYAYNIGDEVGDMQALTYRRNKNRSLSVGDVAVIDGVAYKCDRMGWSQVTIDPSQIVQVTTHGTTPL